MSDEENTQNISLTEAVNRAIGEYLNASGGGIMTNFLFVAEFMGSDGESGTLVCGAENASTSSLLGLSGYAQNFWSECQRREILDTVYCDVDDDEE